MTRSYQILKAHVDSLRNTPHPSDAAIARVRRELGNLLGLTPPEAELHNDASMWRYRIIQARIEKSGDTDVAVGQWLEEGAPMGIDQEIIPWGMVPYAGAWSRPVYR